MEAKPNNGLLWDYCQWLQPCVTFWSPSDINMVSTVKQSGMISTSHQAEKCRTSHHQDCTSNRISGCADHSEGRVSEQLALTSAAAKWEQHLTCCWNVITSIEAERSSTQKSHQHSAPHSPRPRVLVGEWIGKRTTKKTRGASSKGDNSDQASNICETGRSWSKVFSIQYTDRYR